MAIINLPFKGGMSNSIYDEPGRGRAGAIKDLNIFDTVKTLKPSIALINDAGMPANFRPRNAYLASDGLFYFHGDEEIASVNTIMIYSAGSALSSSSTYTSVSAIGGSNTHFPLEEFAGYLWWGRSNNLKKYGVLGSGPSVSTSGATITTTVNFLKTHIGLGKLFYVHGTQQLIGYTPDGTNYTDTALTLSPNDRIIGIEPYGKFLLVGVVDVSYSKKAKILVWDGSSTTVDDVVYLSESGLQGFRVVNGSIEAIAVGRTGLRIYKFPLGGAPGRPASSLDFTVSGVAAGIFEQAIETSGDVLYFGLAAATGSSPTTYSRPIGVFGFGNNTPGYPDALTIDRLISTGSTTASIICVRKFGATIGQEVLVVIALTGTNTYVINHTLAGTNGTLSANGVIESDAFPLKGGNPGKIKRIIINHEAIPTSCGFTVAVKHYGHYPWGTSVPSVGAYADLTTPEGSGSSTGKTQSTTNACMTEIAGAELFPMARYAQVKISFDETSGVNAANIIYPVLVELED